MHLICFRRVRCSAKEGVFIWYILHCKEFKEDEILQMCRRHLSQKALAGCFVLTYDRMRRYEGAWHIERMPLFPGYIFLETNTPKLLMKELKQYIQMFHLLGDNVSAVPVRTEEEQFLRNLCGKDYHLGMSRGYIADGKTHITEGPLRGKENFIRKIDRHKRMAWIVMPEEKNRTVKIGLEIVSKD